MPRRPWSGAYSFWRQNRLESETGTHHWLLVQTPSVPETRLGLIRHPIIIPHRVFADSGDDPSCHMEHDDSVNERQEQVVRQIESDVGDAVEYPTCSAGE